MKHITFTAAMLLAMGSLSSTAMAQERSPSASDGNRATAQTQNQPQPHSKETLGTPGVAALPEGSLAAKRQETIGTPPEPVFQGGAGTAAKEERAEEMKGGLGFSNAKGNSDFTRGKGKESN